MPLPTRPVDAAEIATEWGQQIHDYTFAPAGAVCNGGNVANPSGGAEVTLPIDTAVDDPGGYVDVSGNRIVIPTDGGGLYLIRHRGRTDEGDASDETRHILYVNGAEVGRDTQQQAGSTAIALNIIAFEVLSAGDVINVKSSQIGADARADVGIVQLTLIRLGAEFGAPS
jgi:hypothetical protein